MSSQSQRVWTATVRGPIQLLKWMCLLLGSCFYNKYFNILKNNVCDKYIFKTTERTTFAGLSKKISKPSTQLFFYNRLELFSINWLIYEPLTKGWELVFCSIKEPSHFRGFPRQYQLRELRVLRAKLRVLRCSISSAVFPTVPDSFPQWLTW